MQTATRADSLTRLVPLVVFVACSSPSNGASPAGSSGRAASGSSSIAGAGSKSNGSGGSASGTAGASSSSSGGAQASCSDVTACGGDVVGTWTATSSCLAVSGSVDLSLFGFGCPSAPVTGSLQVTGTWTGNADGTYSDQTITTGTEQFTLAPGCLKVSSTPVTCDGAAGFLTVLGYSSVTCADAPGGGCNCAGTVQQTGSLGVVSISPSPSGSYTTSGNAVTTGAGVRYSYCVTGNTMSWTPQSTSPITTGTVLLQNGGAGSSTSSTSGAMASSATSSTSHGSSSSSTSGTTSGAGSSGAAKGPCDIYQGDPSGTVHCVAAHSTVRALIGSYNGRLYQIRNSAGTTEDIGTLSAGGVADASAQDAFCTGTTCVITTIYDQTGNGNDLQYQGAGSPVGGKDQPASATGESVKVGGNKAYSLFINPGNSYWVDGTKSGVPTGSQPEGMYMVTSGTHANAGCCFDYGNSELDRKADGAGAMDAINFSTITAWGTGAGAGPWVMADLEFGIFTEATTAKNQSDPSQTEPFVTAVLKNNGTTQFTLRGADATTGNLTTFYEGALPAGWSPMKKQGAMVLGSGGDCCATNNNLSEGTFYEGCLVAGYPADATEEAVQANVVAAKYSK